MTQVYAFTKFTASVFRPFYWLFLLHTVLYCTLRIRVKMCFIDNHIKFMQRVNICKHIWPFLKTCDICPGILPFFQAASGLHPG